MGSLLEKLEEIRTSLPRRVRLGLILSLVVLAIVLLLVAGGPTMPLVTWGLIACAILFLATNPKKAIYGLILVAIFYIALSIRVFPPYDGVFLGEWVKFGGNDPWYHMRFVENLVYHFPQQISFDPYTIYPTGLNVQFAPFFDLLLGSLIWFISLGSPNQGTIETVGAYFPAILGALVTIPVYFIGRELFSRTAGLVCAGLIAIMPGEFLFRSLLGFTDHHIAEVLFSTITVLFLILAIKSAKGKDFSHIRRRDWKSLRKPLIYAVLTGLALGIYLLSWVGGLLLVLIIITYVIIQYIIDHLRGKSTDYLCIIGVPIFLIALIMVIPWLDFLAFGELVIATLIISMLTFPVLSGVSRLMAYRKLKQAYYPLVLVGLGSAGAALFWLIDPSLFHSIMGSFGVFNPSVTTLTIMEARPLFSGFDISSLTDHRVWRYFTTGLFIVPIALLLISYAAIKEKSAGKIFLVIWSTVMLVAMLGQTRFAYYFAVNAALLTGYFCWRMPRWISGVIAWFGIKEPSAAEKRKEEKRKRRKEAKKGRSGEGEELRGVMTRYLKPGYISATLAIVIVFFLAFYPNIMEAKTLAKNPWGPNDDWHDSLVWLRENSPDPFEDPDFYYELYERPPAGEAYDYPESAYGVMSWWDYGHWITRIAHRIPNANPHQYGIGGPFRGDTPGACTFLTAQNESSASEMLDELGSRYVIIDVETATSKFPVIPTWAGLDRDEFFEAFYWTTPEGTPQSGILYHPAYYQSMCSRLYNFAGEAVVPVNSTWVISYAERIDEQGNRYKVLTDIANEGQPFATYEEAQAYVDENPGYIIVGTNAFLSPVPLEELEHYELIYQSDSVVVERGDENITYVEIFEYLP